MAAEASLDTKITVTIDLDAIVDNWRTLSEMVAPAECAAVVKTNAYGLGVNKIAPKLAKAGCKSFYVATLDGAAQLRELLPDDCTVMVFHGVVSAGEAKLAADNRLVPILNSTHQIALWQDEAKHQGRVLPAGIHVDTGMRRLGLSFEEAQAIAQNPASLEGVDLQILLSHLSNSADAEAPSNPEQLTAFEKVRALFPSVKACFGNSGGIQLGQGFYADMVRPGGSLYGINPLRHRGLESPVKVVAKLEATILQIQTTESDCVVGYCSTYTAKKGARLATVGIGYADGILRTLSNVGHAWVAGHAVPYAGLVSMDLLTLDISDVPEDAVKPGDRVEIYGKNIRVETLADRVKTTPYELFTGLGSRVHRIYHGE